MPHSTGREKQPLEWVASWRLVLTAKAIAGVVSSGYRIPELRVSAKSCPTRSLAKAIEPEFVCQSIAILA